MPSKDFKPKLLIEKTISKWRLLFLAMLAGGIAAYGAAGLFPARYEAVAQVTTNIDYSIAPEIDDHMEDRAINEVGWLMVSYPVLSNVLETVKEQGMEITYQDIMDHFTVERIDDLWTLRVTGSDPEAAAFLANVWVDEAYTQLDAASEHAQAASALRAYIYSLKNCLDALPDQSGNFALCTVDNVDKITKELTIKTKQLNEELELSRAIHPAQRYALVSHALTPTEPTFHVQGVLVLNGALLGLIFAVVYLLMRASREK